MVVIYTLGVVLATAAMCVALLAAPAPAPAPAAAPLDLSSRLMGGNVNMDGNKWCALLVDGLGGAGATKRPKVATANAIYYRQLEHRYSSATKPKVKITVSRGAADRPSLFGLSSHIEVLFAPLSQRAARRRCRKGTAHVVCFVSRKCWTAK